MSPKSYCLLVYVGSFASVAFADESRIFHAKSPYLQNVKDEDVPKVFEIYQCLAKESQSWAAAAFLTRDVHQLIGSMDARINMEGRKAMNQKLLLLSVSLGWRQMDYYKTEQNAKNAIQADASLSPQEKEKRIVARQEAGEGEVVRLRAIIVAASKNGWSVVQTNAPKNIPKK